MKLRLVLLLLLATGSAFAEPMGGGGGLPQFLMADVFGSALAFMAPRTLDPIPVGDLTMWGLHGITAIDPNLSTSITPAGKADQIDLTGPGGTIISLPAPAPDDAAAWGEAAAKLAEAAAGVSAPVRAAGAAGVIQSFFEELFNHLDPYSRYVSPSNATTDRANRRGLGGVGFVTVEIRHQLAVGDIAPGSPADQVGVQIGDLVQTVDGHSTQGKSAAEVNRWLAGDVGSFAEITLRHPGTAPDTIELDRVLVPPSTVGLSRDGNLAVITISGFSADTAARFKNALDQIATYPHVEGLILDLRDNRGGLLHQAVDIASMLLSSGTIVSTQGRAPASNHDFIAALNDLTHGMSTIVLVDGRTASAAEILAASLADNRRAVVVGSATLGKGLVQTILQLPDGGELFLTWSRVIAPRGWPIQGLGVMPQVCTSNGNNALDQQLAALADGHQPMAAALARTRAARAPLPSVQLLELRAPCPAAEASDNDIPAAHWLIDHPIAYQTALLPANH